MKFNIFLIFLMLSACTLCFIACYTIQQDKASTTKSEIEICTESSEENTTTSTEKFAIDDDNFESYKVVDNVLLELCKSEEFINATNYEQVQLALSTLEKLEDEGFIIQNSIVYNENSSNSIEFKYTNGALGRFVLKDFSPKIN